MRINVNLLIFMAVNLSRIGRSRNPVNIALVAGIALYVIVFCGVPFARLLLELVNSCRLSGFAVVSDVLGSASTRRALFHSLESGVGATILSTLFGTLMALLMGMTNIRLKPVLVFLLILPMLIPAQITALAWLELLAPSSPLLKLIGCSPAPGTINPLYSREGIILLMGIEHSSIVFLTVFAGIRALPSDLLEAAKACGGSAWYIVSSITLPLLRPYIVVGSALAFVSAIGNFGIPAFLGIPGRYTVLTTLVYQRLNGFGPSVISEIAVLAIMLAGLAFAGLVIQMLALRSRPVELDRTGGTGQQFSLGKWRGGIEVFVWALMLFISLMPIIALTITSFTKAIGMPLSWEALTLDHYAYAFRDASIRSAFVNSTILAVTAAVCSVFVCLPLSYMIVRQKSLLTRFINSLADTPYSLPGIVLSISCILIYLKPLPLVNISLYNTLLIILVAYLGRFLSLALRPSIAAVTQVDTRLEESAQLAGANMAVRLKDVYFPLIAPAAVAGGFLIFMSAFNELTVSALLWSSGSETLGVIIYNLYDEGAATGAAAVSLLTILATLLISLFLTLFAKKFPDKILPWQV